MIYFTSMKKNLFSKTAVISVLITLCIYGGAIAIYFYANGWRFNVQDIEVVKTGVLTVESYPNQATLYIDEDAKGSTPKSVGLKVGTYNVKISKKGYVDWHKNIRIEEGKSTLVFPWLIKEKIDSESIFSKEEELLKSWIDDSQRNILFLTKVVNPETSEYLYTYNIWNYNVNPAFWDLSNNPFVITSILSNDNIDLDLIISTEGDYSILSYASKNYLLDNQKNTEYDELPELSLTDFDTYTKTWSNDDNYIILESDSDIVSYDINKNTKYLLVKKQKDVNYIYSTDNLGLFYLLVQKESEDPDLNIFNITQRKLDGTGTATLVKDIYFQNNAEFISSYRENRTDLDSYTCSPFTNSPECTKTIGSINYININRDAKGIFLNSSEAAYWYDLDTKKFLMVSAYPSTLIAFSPDQKKILYKDPAGLNIFTFDKEDADLTSIIGSTNIISDIKNCSNFNWIFNSRYVSYVEDNNLLIIDRGGDNQTLLIDTINYNQSIITNTGENIVTLEKLEEIDQTSNDIVKSFVIKHFSIN